MASCKNIARHNIAGSFMIAPLVLLLHKVSCRLFQLARQLAGHDIDLYFTLWQDGAFTLQNMYVDDISIPEIGFTDDVEAGEDGWMTNGWYVTDGILVNDWEVTILTCDYPALDLIYSPRHITVSPVTQSGDRTLGATGMGEVNIAIVSNRADHILGSGYDLWIEDYSYPAWWL